jgi:hypothetical protein
VLSREVTRPTDNLFDLRGDSLLLTWLHDRLTDMTGVEIPMGELFSVTTLRRHRRGLPRRNGPAVLRATGARRKRAMGRKRMHRPEEIVAKSRQVEVLLTQGKQVPEAVRAIAVSEATYFH